MGEDPWVTVSKLGLVGVHVTLTVSPREGETGNLTENVEETKGQLEYSVELIEYKVKLEKETRGVKTLPGARERICGG